MGPRRHGGRARARRDERGYVAVLTVLLFPVIFAMAAFTVDVGNWYLTSQQNQRAADAAALAGVTFMPADYSQASAAALDLSKRNGLAPGANVNVAPAQVDGQPNRLKVTVSKTVHNAFGGLFGAGTTTISRAATAAFTGPVPMGSPCNEFGNDPTPDSVKSTNCADVGAFWANVGSPKADKVSGDAYQDGYCSSGDGCSSGHNTEFDNNGYFYTLTVKSVMPSLTVQAFDPAFVSVGDTCGTNFGSGDTIPANAKNHFVYDATPAPGSYKTTDTAGARYAKGSASAYCTGDQIFTHTSTPPDTTFSVRRPVATTYPWDPISYETQPGCTTTFKGFSGNLYTALNQWQQTKKVVQYNSDGSPVAAPAADASGANGYNEAVASEFRQWVPLCTMTNVQPGTYMIQVQTNGPDDTANGDGHNRFALRAFGTNPAANVDLSIAGFAKMAVYANLPSAVTQFYLAKVPPTTAGQILKVRLFDVGDSSNTGTVTILPPADSHLTNFPTCTGTGPVTVQPGTCSIQTDASHFQGKWETITIPLPTTYTCDTTTETGCWVKLQYDYGHGNQPSDTTSWQAGVEGDPVRLVR
jgi:Flp pilus assembly protein TadG